ncbi:hypothetical protein [Jeotgalibacillus sp. JSM ZJ347]|uniref:hypothetical protein n=1 Tax=Jeotgalibacillus sp. JSM ZJ347 TaxID=3342117 RepID=UPI0035A865CC
MIACGNLNFSQSEELHLSDVYTASFSDITEVEIVNGATGESVVISEQAAINNFSAELEKMELEEIPSAEEKEGYSWMVKLKSKNGEYRMNGYNFGEHYFKSEPDFNEIFSEYLGS